MLTKIELRKKAKEIRNSLDMKNISENISKAIINSDVYKNAQHIMIFYPIGHEVNLLHLLNEENGKKFYLPKVDGEDLLVCPYKSSDKLEISTFKTKEPLTNPVEPGILDIIFVPALMVDKKFNRLGYGGGFYDKFLSKYKLKAKKIVAIPSALIVDELPNESFDEKIDIIICEDNNLNTVAQ